MSPRRATAILHTLLDVRHQQADLRTERDSLTDACIARSVTRNVIATWLLHRRIHELNACIARLLEQVTPYDREVAGEITESLGELVVRSKTLLILLLLDQLADALASTSADARGSALLTGRFRRLEDVIVFVHCELSRINRIWLQHRALNAQSARSNPGGADGRRSLYRAAVREAQRAIIALGADADFARFLHVGAALCDHPAICDACTTIEEIIPLEVDLEPDPAWFGAEPDPLAFDRAPPAHRPHVATATRRHE